jgi:hypothetical protein
VSVTIEEILGRFNGRQLDGKGLLIAEINGVIAAEEHAARLAGKPIKLQRVVGFDDRKAILSMIPETGAQERDGKMSHDTSHGQARLDKPQDADRAARPSDSPLAKFGRIWGN